ncbi:MAG TPA: hypothetical protein VFQ61_15975, partial [Polyangiaceae bacterium]|nr:hypothetical protein [Polyangiaceae bacterium]
ARKSRRGRAQTFIDLAVPRDVDPAGGELDDVFIYNIDDFSRVVAETLSARSREAELGERIVDEETRGYERWAEAEQATPLIVRLREEVRRALRLELERSTRGRLKHLGLTDREALETMLDAAANRILHAPTMRLREAAQDRKSGTLSFDDLSLALSELFGLAEGRADPEMELVSQPRAAGPSGTPGALGDSIAGDEKSHVTGTLGKWPNTS